MAAVESAALPAALHLRPRLVDGERTPIRIHPVKRSDRLVSRAIVGHFDEGEAARAPGIAVGHDGYALHLAVGLEHGAKFAFSHTESEIADEYLFHIDLPFSGSLGAAFSTGRNWLHIHCGLRSGLGCAGSGRRLRALHRTRNLVGIALHASAGHCCRRLPEGLALLYQFFNRPGTLFFGVELFEILAVGNLAILETDLLIEVFQAVFAGWTRLHGAPVVLARL